MNLTLFLTVSAVLLLVSLLVGGWLLRRIKRAGRLLPGQMLLTQLSSRLKRNSDNRSMRDEIKRRLHRFPWLILIELGAIGVWAAIVGQPYLDPNPMMWPSGSEIGIQINTHYFWTEAQRCGLCALWDGAINGGTPALADPFGARLHPVVALTTLLFGVINGAKLSLVIFFWLAGVAQWWLARTLKLGWLPRLWSAGLAVVGGHLAARMQTGQFAMIASTVSCSLALAAAIDLAATGRRRSAVALGVLGALAIMSGHGYVQLTLVGWAPAFVFVLLDRNFRPKPVWREYALALGLSLLIAAVFLVPVLHFMPNYTKDSDFTFGFAQTLEYIPINLIARDMTFVTTPILGKSGEAELHAMYIGWLPIVLAVLTLRFARRRDTPILLTLMAGIAISFLFASAVALRWLVPLSDFFNGFRHPSLMLVLAIPAILTFAAYGLDGLLKLNWPQLLLRPQPGDAKLLAMNLAWLLLIPLAWSLTSAFDFTRYFIRNSDVSSIYGFYANIQNVLTQPGLKWVAPPYGEGNLVEPALHFGAKLTNVVFPSHWRDHDNPDPEIVISRQGDYPGAERIAQLNDVPVYRFPDQPYAFVDLGDRRVPCVATGGSGDIEVTCSADQAGQLIVRENSWTGWGVTIDDGAAELAADRWLGVAAPAGSHRYVFRYRPFDALFGALLTLIGLALAGWLWRRPVTPAPEAAPPCPEPSTSSNSRESDGPLSNS